MNSKISFERASGQPPMNKLIMVAAHLMEHHTIYLKHIETTRISTTIAPNQDSGYQPKYLRVHNQHPTTSSV